VSHAQRLGAFGAGLAIDQIPQDVIYRVKLHLLDTVAVAFAFAREPLASELVRIGLRGRPTGRATLIGFAERTSMREAAFVNGALAHGKDFDDVHVASITHPTAVVAPAILAVAEAYGLPGAAVIEAMAFGVEIVARLGLSGGAAMARQGIPPMTACGALAAAGATAKLLGLSPNGIAAAIGVSGSFACGSHEWTTCGTNSKLTTVGWVARVGVIAAHMAQAGFDGSMSAIEGKKGLLVAMAGPGAFDPNEPSAQLGERWETRNLSLKRFASCQGTQPYITAALDLVRSERLLPSDVAAVEIVIGAGVGASLSEPFEMKRAPLNGYAAKFSIPFCVALAITEGDVRLSHFEADWERVRGVAALARRVQHTVDPSFDEGGADRGLVRVHLADGRTLEAEHRTSQSRLTLEDLSAKFEQCADWALGPSRRAEIINAFMDLDRVPDLAKVMPLLALANP
jgi:2-methylcitrate dehydratase PrpD